VGARWSEVWVKARDAAAAGALEEEEGAEAAPGSFARTRADDFDGAQASPDAWGDLGTREASSQYGEAVFVAMYDGPAGELCGTFLYERAVEGRVVRALVLAPDLDAGDQVLRWRRVEGTPEPWEAALAAAHADVWVADHVRRRSWQDEPPPPPTAAERAALRARCLTFEQGADLPRPSEYLLAGAGRRG